MVQGILSSNETKTYRRFILLDFIILILSIIFPLILIILNQSNDCSHHINKLGGNYWIIGRSLGFTTVIWFVFSIIKGIKIQKITKLFDSELKARNYHCRSAFITNIIFVLHVLFLLFSDPWGPLIFEMEYNHLPFVLFVIKIWTGVIFGIILVITSILFFYLKDINRLEKFGYKKLIKIHHFMLILTVILVVHIFLINTEVLIILYG